MTIGIHSIAAHSDPAEPAGGELKGMMSQVLAHIAAAERRNEALLAEVRQRLETLSHGARITRATVPNDYLPGFERIEDGIHILADRIASSYAARLNSMGATPIERPTNPAAAFVEQPTPPAAVDVYVPPAPVSSNASEQIHALSSTTPGLMRARSGPYASHIDTFDVIESLPGNPTEAWSADEVAALSDVYNTPDTLFGNDVSSNPFATEQPSAAHQSLASDPAATDRNWIDQRLTDIATRVERSLAASRSDVALGALEHRFGDFEQRLTLKLGTVATKSDLASLTVIEDQIHALRSQFEQAHVELMRIDDLERQLGHLVEQVSDEKLSAMISRSMPAPSPAMASRPDVELHSIAIAAAEAAAARVAKTHSMGTGRVDEVHTLLTDYMSERRYGEEQTAITLDTLQQAMLRVLDRVEAFETAMLPTYVDHAAHPEPKQHQTPLEPAFEAELQHRHDLTAPLPVRAPHRDEPRDTVEPVSAAPVGDYLSEQRAKMQASVQRAATAQREKVKAQAEAANGAPNARIPRPAKPAANSARLMVSMLALAVMAGGGAAVVMSLPREEPRTLTAAPTQPAPAATANQIAKSRLPQSSNEAVSSALNAPNGSASNQLAQSRDGSNAGTATNQIPETVTEDLGSTNLVPEIDRVPDRTTTRANMVKSQYTTPSAVSGVLLQESAPADVPAPTIVNPARGMATTAMPISATPADLPTGPTEAVDTEQPRSALDLPPATVGPLSLRLAAARGDKSAQFEVASRLAEGKGTDQNLKEAVRWYQRSAAQGFTQAQYRLGTFYERGLGVKADVTRARTWYQRSADQGNVKAMHNLAVLAAGRSAESPDYATAAHWFTQAAGYGLPDSQFNLAVLTESGLGVEKDLVQAAMWFSIAARSGDKESIRRRDLMKSKLLPADLAKAEHLAKGWQPLVQEKLANDPHAAGEAWKSVLAQPQAGTNEN